MSRDRNHKRKRKEPSSSSNSSGNTSSPIIHPDETNASLHHHTHRNKSSTNMNDITTPPKSIVIDGSYKEGGGQILRNTITYAVLLQQQQQPNKTPSTASTTTITNIRANRPNRPGVRPQHLAGMTLAVEIGGGSLTNAAVGATSVSYVSSSSSPPPQQGASTKSDEDSDNNQQPTKSTESNSVKSNNNNNDDCLHYLADTGTAGSIALLLQASFLPALTKAMRMRSHNPTPVTIEFRGGTNASGAPQIDYVTEVFVPFVNSYFGQSSDNQLTENRMIPTSATTKSTSNKRSRQQSSSSSSSNASAESSSSSHPAIMDVQILKRGYYPRGGGIVQVHFQSPSSLSTNNDTTKPNNNNNHHSSSGITFPPIKLTNCAPISSMKIKAYHAGKCPSYIAQKMVVGAKQELTRAWKSNSHSNFRKRFMNKSVIESVTTEIVHEANCLGSGSGILIVAYPTTSSSSNVSSSSANNSSNNSSPLPYHPPLASSALGDRKISPQTTGSTAAKEIIEAIASGGCVDRWFQDQLIPFMALADNNDSGRGGGNNDKEDGCNKDTFCYSEVLCGELTLHTQTAMHVAERMTGCKFEVERLDDNDCSKDEKGKNGNGNEDDDTNNIYGEAGRVLGRHIVRCRGIGFAYA